MSQHDQRAYIEEMMASHRQLQLTPAADPVATAQAAADKQQAHQAVIAAFQALPAEVRDARIREMAVRTRAKREATDQQVAAFQRRMSMTPKDWRRLLERPQA